MWFSNLKKLLISNLNEMSVTVMLANVEQCISYAINFMITGVKSETKGNAYIEFRKRNFFEVKSISVL